MRRSPPHLPAHSEKVPTENPLGQRLSRTEVECVPVNVRTTVPLRTTSTRQSVSPRAIA